MNLTRTQQIAVYTEELEKAEQSAAFVVSELQAAHKAAAHANPVLALLVLRLLEDAANLQTQLQLVNQATKPE